jgi:hypothetical protein
MTSHRGTNSIDTGEVKLFDARTLFEKFQSLQSALSGMGPFYSASQLAGGIGVVQGASISQNQQQVNAMLQLPTTTLSSSNGNSTNNSTVTTSGSTNAVPNPTTVATSSTATTTGSSTNGLNQVAPTIPGLQTLPTISGLSAVPTPAQSASNLLEEQTQLNFQLTNLSLLLDRSISDRIIHESNYLSHPRLEAVVGLDITVEPKYRNAVAEVEVTITPAQGGAPGLITKGPILANDADGEDGAPTLITLLPQQKTYNVATISNNTSGYNFGAVFQFLGISAAGTNSRANQYLVRDVDTIGYQGMTDAQQVRDLSFGWQFRPVLNQDTVQPGTRSVFAVIALPDRADNVKPGEEMTPPAFTGQVSVTTRWRAYDRKHGIVGALIGTEETHRLRDLHVYPAFTQDNDLGPKISNLSIADAGGGNVLLSLQGSNFFAGTVVSAGQVTGLPLSNYSLASEQRFRCVLPAVQLFEQNPTLVGPYGTPAPIYDPDNDNHTWRINILKDKSGVVPLDSQTLRAHIEFLVQPQTLTAFADGFPATKWSNWISNTTNRNELLDSAKSVDQTKFDRFLGYTDWSSKSGTTVLNGIDLKQKLKERLMQNDVEGFTQLLDNIGITPPTVPVSIQTDKAFGADLSSRQTWDVTRSGIGVNRKNRPEIPVVTEIGGQVYGLVDNPFIGGAIGDPANKHYYIEFDIPSSLLRAGRQFHIQPLGFDKSFGDYYTPGPEMTYTSQTVNTYLDFAATSALLYPVGADSVGIFVQGRNLTDGQGIATVLANGKPLVPTSKPTDQFITAQLKTADARGLRSLVVYRTGMQPQIVPVTMGSGNSVLILPPKVNQGDTISVDLGGANLDRITGVTYNGKPVTWGYDLVKGKGTLGPLDKDLVGQEGQKTLVFALNDGTVMTANLTVSAQSSDAKASSSTPAPVPTSKVTANFVLTKGHAGQYQVWGDNLDQVVSAAILGGPKVRWFFEPDAKGGLLEISNLEMKSLSASSKIVFKLKNAGDLVVPAFPTVSKKSG